MKNLFFISILLVLLSASCKPTEKGYKAAYDAALGKREAAMADIDVNLPEGALQQVDGPQLKEVDGVSVYLLNQRIKPVDGTEETFHSYNVAIGSYKMQTNCRAQVADLKQQGYKAFGAYDADNLFYTIAGSFPTLSEAVKFYKEYRSGSKKVYVGLPDAPVIIFSPH